MMLSLHFLSRVKSFSRPDICHWGTNQSNIDRCGTDRCRASFRVVTRSMYRAADRRNNVDIFYKKPRKKPIQEDFVTIQADIDVAPYSETPVNQINQTPASAAPASAAPASAAPASAGEQLADVSPLVPQSLPYTQKEIKVDSSLTSPSDPHKEIDSLPDFSINPLLNQKQTTHPSRSSFNAQPVSIANNILEKEVSTVPSKARPRRTNILLSASECQPEASGTSPTKRFGQSEKPIPALLPKPRRLAHKTKQIVSDSSKDKAEQTETPVVAGTILNNSNLTKERDSNCVEKHLKNDSDRGTEVSDQSMDQMLENPLKAQDLPPKYHPIERLCSIMALKNQAPTTLTDLQNPNWPAERQNRLEYYQSSFNDATFRLAEGNSYPKLTLESTIALVCGIRYKTEELLNEQRAQAMRNRNNINQAGPSKAIDYTSQSNTTSNQQATNPDQAGPSQAMDYNQAESSETRLTATQKRREARKRKKVRERAEAEVLNQQEKDQSANLQDKSSDSQDESADSMHTMQDACSKKTQVQYQKGKFCDSNMLQGPPGLKNRGGFSESSSHQAEAYTVVALGLLYIVLSNWAYRFWRASKRAKLINKHFGAKG